MLLKLQCFFTEHFPFFTEIQKLMGCFAFIRIGLENSPYADFLDPVNWLEINEILAKDACALMGLSVSSPLEVRYVVFVCIELVIRVIQNLNIAIKGGNIGGAHLKDFSSDYCQSINV